MAWDFTTEPEFQELLDWQQAAQLDRVGCFEYSPVEGAAANAIDTALLKAKSALRWRRPT